MTSAGSTRRITMNQNSSPGGTNDFGASGVQPGMLTDITRSPIKMAMAVLSPFVALAFQLSLWTWVQPFIWFFFYPAVFISAWLGGLVGGMASTAISIALVVYFFVPPIHDFAIDDSRHLIVFGMFGLMGTVFAFFHQRLQLMKVQVAQALKDESASERRFRTMFETAEGQALSFPTRQQPTSERPSDEAAQPHFINEKEFQLLAESVPQIVWITEANGKNVFFNQKWVDYTGLTMEESYGDGWNKPFHPDDRQRAWEAWQNAVNNNDIYSLECRLRRADGVYRWWLVRGVPAIDDEGNIYKWFGTCTDIHDLKEAEEKLRANRQILESAFASMSDGIFISDLSGHFTEMNEAFARLHRFKTKAECSRILTDYVSIVELHGMGGELVGPENWPVAKGFRGESGVNEEYRLRRLDTGEDWIASYNYAPIYNAQGKIVGSVVTGRDITEIKNTEQALQELNSELELRVQQRTAEIIAKTKELALAEERLRLAMQATKDGLWDWHIETGDFYTDATFKLMLGYDTQSLSDRELNPWYERIHPEDQPVVMPTVMKWLTEQGHFEMEFRIQAQNGQYRWILSRGQTAERDDSGKPLRAIGTHLDITERKEAELALQESERRYRELSDSLEQKVEQRTHELTIANSAKTQFLGQMSHELRTPMNAIMGFTQLLEREALQPDHLDMVRMIHESGANLLRIIDDLLDLSKIEAGKLAITDQPFTLASVRERFDRTFHRLADEKGLTFTIQMPSTDVGTLEGDAERLEQILNNFINNAIKFTERGQVSVRISVTSMEADALRLRFEVSDTGIGIEPSVLRTLFQPFTQGDASINRRFGGTGLGLFISKRIAEAMGGELGVRSDVGQGSTFWFEVPFKRVAATAGEHATSPAPLETTQPLLTGLQVLAVDDNAINLKMIERVLQLQGAKVTLATNGQEALQTLRADAERYDIVLMDVQMPVMDGLAATREIRGDSGLSKLPVIVLTAGVLPEEREAALMAGASDFVTKPLDLQQIKSVLSKYTQQTT
ncbi:MAG: PAS domain-containing protein [Methylococcus sp.]